MRGGCLILLFAGGCNVIFGLEPAGGDGDDTADRNAIHGRVHAVNVDHLMEMQPVQGYEAGARLAPYETCVRLVTDGDCYAEMLQ